VSTPTRTTVPAQFAEFDQLEGLDPVNKATLVGTPFGITAVRFRTNDRSVVFAEAEIVSASGDLLGLSDSSTGIRDQLSAYLLNTLGIQPSGELPWTEVKLYVPRGLRVSVYDVEVNGQTRQAKTYYLTTRGRASEPAASGQATESRKRTR